MVVKRREAEGKTMEGKSDAGGMDRKEGEAENIFNRRWMERRMNEGHGEEGREWQAGKGGMNGLSVKENCKPTNERQDI